MRVRIVQCFLLKTNILLCTLIVSSVFLNACRDNNNGFEEETIYLSDIQDYPEIDLKICFHCRTREEVYHYERKLGSKAFQLESWQIKRIMKNSINPAYSKYGLGYRDSVPKPYYTAFGEDYYLFFDRSETMVGGFSQLVIYRLSLDYNEDNEDEHSIEYIYTRFHLGSEPFGYEPRGFVKIGNSDKYSLTETRNMQVADFKRDYHAVIKSFFKELRADYAKTERNYLIDDFYGEHYRYPIETDTLLLEEEWMHKFLNTKYVFWRGERTPLGSIIPNTHAPTKFYQDRGARNGSNKFEINVSDLSFTLTYYVDSRYSYY